MLGNPGDRGPLLGALWLISVWNFRPDSRRESKGAFRAAAKLQFLAAS